MADDSLSSSDKEKRTGTVVDELIVVLHASYKLSKMVDSRRHHSLFSMFNALSFDREGGMSKSTATAIEFKNFGNEDFGNGNYENALSSYTESLAHAEEDSEEAAYAYANRSAALFKLGKYELSLLDIDRALDGKYPENKKEKLRERKKRCLKELRQAKLNSGIDEGDQISSEEIDAEWRNLCDFTNPLLPSTSNKIKLECNETWGRFMVATEDIEPGEILSSEKFFSLMVESELKYVYCSCCLSSCYSLIPCPSCNQAMYCSELCRTRAFNLYHRVECKVLQSRDLRGELDEGDLVALRMLLIGTEQGASLKTIMKKLTVPDIFAEKIDPADKPFASDYLSALKLRRTFRKPLYTNHTTKPGPVARTIIALQNAGYFGNDSGADCRKEDVRLNESELFVALLFFNHILSVKGNIFSVVHLLNSDPIRRERIGSGVCNLHNMINHSCDPNANCFLRDQEHVVFAVRPISKGEQIFISYSDTFATSTMEDRLSRILTSKLSGNYRFACQCEACTNKWPLYEVLMKREAKFLRKNPEKEMKEFYKVFAIVAKTRISTLSHGEILQVVRKLCRWIHTNIEKPSVDIVNCEHLLSCVLKYFYGTLLPENMTEVRKKQEIESLMKATVQAILWRSETALL